MSFNIALSGLYASGEEMSVISNNIANSNTPGFKGSRAEFGSVYNGKQAGGVQVTGITQNFDLNGSIQGTGRGLDMALSGTGFFVVQDSKGQPSYTRSGMFNTDLNGFVVDGAGSRLQGYGVDANNSIQTGNVTSLQIKTDSIAAKASGQIDFASNLDARAPVIDPLVTPFDPSDSTTYTHTYTTPVYDSLGNQHNVQQFFVKTGPNTWDVHATVNGAAAPAATTAMTFNPDGTISTGGSYSVPFNPPGANPMNINMDLSSLSQYGSDFVVSKSTNDGYSSGEFTGVRIEPDGSVFASYSNGQSLLQGQVVLANFNSPQNLLKTSNTSWQQTYGSGVPVYGTAGTGVFSEIVSGAIEASNVDLTSELVGLMSVQRNYSANTKALSATDQIANTLMQAI
ncbi:flagellar basal body protein FlaE [Vibrio parahaemolyticus]|nr:flagellar basal body protein FlaE [Vibrio parahaemolyticus]